MKDGIELNEDKNYDQYQKDISRFHNSNIYDQQNDQFQNQYNNDPNFSGNLEKIKRHRRGKNEINDRNFRCPDCDKCYLSGPALTTHRKTKHGYGNNGEKRARGRPRKDCLNENIPNDPQNKYLFFFSEEHRKCLDDNIINLDVVKNDLRIIFKQCQQELFNEIDDVENYSFYQLIVENWEKEIPDLIQECFIAINKIEDPLNKIQSYNLDVILFTYLKEFYKNANLEYFWFMIKFIVLFRECVNRLRADLVKKDQQNKLYSEIYNCENAPEVCNDFLLEFMEPYDYFGMNKEELIELILHFCYWLNFKEYTHLNLSLLNNK